MTANRLGPVTRIGVRPVTTSSGQMVAGAAGGAKQTPAIGSTANAGATGLGSRLHLGEMMTTMMADNRPTSKMMLGGEAKHGAARLSKKSVSVRGLKASVLEPIGT